MKQLIEVPGLVSKAKELSANSFVQSRTLSFLTSKAVSLFCNVLQSVKNVAGPKASLRRRDPETARVEPCDPPSGPRLQTSIPRHRYPASPVDGAPKWDFRVVILNNW